MFAKYVAFIAYRDVNEPRTIEQLLVGREAGLATQRGEGQQRQQPGPHGALRSRGPLPVTTSRAHFHYTHSAFGHHQQRAHITSLAGRGVLAASGWWSGSRSEEQRARRDTGPGGVIARRAGAVRGATFASARSHPVTRRHATDAIVMYPDTLHERSET